MSDAHDLVDRFYALFVSVDPEGARDILAPDWVNHPADEGRNPDVAGFIQGIGDLGSALTPLRIRRLVTVVEGDLVVCRMHLSGRFVSAFGGYEPTGQESGFDAMDMHRIADGRIAETWHFERLEMLADGR
ncbi:ester cyclase [Millisia brevis]|uniref:ester cyclase n=1 Tax=Millisia brevis TaxID=264148 RepID=UPI00082D98B2|nr:ester cyclase [Millisia brevis]